MITSTVHAVSSEEEFKFAEVPEVPVHAPLKKDLLIDLRRALEEANGVAVEQLANNRRPIAVATTPAPIEAADELFEALQGIASGDTRHLDFFQFKHGYVCALLLQRFQIPPQFQLIHVVRWCNFLQAYWRGALEYSWSQQFLQYQQHQKKQIDARELAAVFRTVGIGDGEIGESIIRSGRFVAVSILRVNPDLVWPYFAERVHLLEQALTFRPDLPRYSQREQRHNALRILTLFPRPPQKLVPLLWDLAFGNDKTERPLAHECINKLPNKEQTLIAALASTDQNTRRMAAEWLGTLRHKEAIPALRLALSKEKNEIVKEKLIKSLETLGVGLEELLDIDKLDREAEKGLKKGVPKELDWFPFSTLPSVRWADSGKPVPATIIQWFIVQGFKLKNAEANTTFRGYCSLFQKEDREQLGRVVLNAWIAEDTKLKYTPEQAAAEAQTLTKQSVRQARHFGNRIDEQQVYKANFNRLLTEVGGSQASTKGILAVAGACCGGDAAPVVHHYIKQWFGYRAAQCKALLQVLAWIDDRRATQVILSVANRFRTKAIQEEALRQCELLAERKGWTVDELADRTIPTAGLDETGSMELDYGSRKFAARLSEEMTIEVTNKKGKVISSLPDANQADDAEKVKQAKAMLSNARKELKSVLAMQKDRLYEALCTQRTWRFEDWDTYLRQHPIVGRYCQRLVWAAYKNERVVETFRPLADGTLTNRKDDEVTFKPDTAIRLGHDETLAPKDRKAWLQHFSDYEVEPLVQQFGKATLTLPDNMKEAREINEFLGYMTKTFPLRNRLTKLGYTRGPIRDSGGFRDYRKTFPRLGVDAVIEFSGSGVPEENITVALKRLYFTRSDNDPYRVDELTLAELPRVLIAECWNDIRMAAADGPGFAADWKRQAEV